MASSTVADARQQANRMGGGDADADAVPVAQAADGTLIVGRGIPNDWVTPGKAISVTNVPTTNRNRISIRISASERSVTLTLIGSARSVLFQLPLFVDNIATSSAGSVVQATGTIALSAQVRTVTVLLRHS